MAREFWMNFSRLDPWMEYPLPIVKNALMNPSIIRTPSTGADPFVHPLLPLHEPPTHILHLGLTRTD